MSQTSGITGSPLLQTLLNQADAVSGARTAQTAAAGATITTKAAADSAQLSTVASALQRSSSADDGRAEKVQSIQAAIANGSYSVAAEDVAGKVIQALVR